MTSKGDVIARYGNFYRGDDDLFTHCLILRDGQCWLLGQGLRPVTLRNFRLSAFASTKSGLSGQILRSGSPMLSRPT
jgi:hypothetical protein